MGASRGRTVALVTLVALLPVIGLAALVVLLSTQAEGPDASTAEVYRAPTARATEIVEASKPPSVLGDRGDEEPASDERSSPGEGAPPEDPETPTQEEPPPNSSAPPRADPASAGAPGGSIRIPDLGVNAPLIALNIDANGNMAAPDGPDLVAWYDFTSPPGAGSGNAVFAGHRDWAGGGPAVFWDLALLEAGDTIEVTLGDGTTVQYAVTAAHTYPVANIDMRAILAPTQRETLTLITCAGTFEGNDYTDRHVVRAVRVQ